MALPKKRDDNVNGNNFCSEPQKLSRAISKIQTQRDTSVRERERETFWLIQTHTHPSASHTIKN